MICKCIVIGWVGNISVSQKNISIVTCRAKWIER